MRTRRARRRSRCSPSWREKGDRQNALLRRDAAVEERAAIPALIFPQLGRIDEKRVAGREQRVRAQPSARQAKRVFVREEQRLLRILGAQVFAEFVAEVLRRVSL